MYYLMLANLSTAYFHTKICRMCVEIKFEEKNPKMIQPNSILLSELYSLLYFISNSRKELLNDRKKTYNNLPKAKNWQRSADRLHVGHFVR